MWQQVEPFLRHFQRLYIGVATEMMAREIITHPELWDQYRERKDAAGSPHAEMSDIWVRFRDRAELTSPEKYCEPHFPVWYPARDVLPSVEDACHKVMAYVGATILGGVLITKIPPGGKILRHNDRGGWHAEFYNKKVYVPIQSAPGCTNFCYNDDDEGCEVVHMKEGQVWSFDNLRDHAVVNDSDRDRITLIICMRCD